MSNKGRHIESLGQYDIREWTGPQVESGKMQRYSSELRGSFDKSEHATLEDARAHVRLAPAIRVVRVEFEAYVPVNATEAQIEEWIEYELHANGGIDTSNPLHRHSLEARNVDVTV